MERTAHQDNIFVSFSSVHIFRCERQLNQTRQLSKIDQFVLTAELLSRLSNGFCFASISLNNNNNNNKFKLLSTIKTNSSNML